MVAMIMHSVGIFTGTELVTNLALPAPRLHMLGFHVSFYVGFLTGDHVAHSALPLSTLQSNHQTRRRSGQV